MADDQKISLIKQMLKPVLREQTLPAGTFVDERLGLGMGWVFRDGSNSNHMTVWNENQDVYLLFHGECFGQEQEIQDLHQKEPLGFSSH